MKDGMFSIQGKIVERVYLGTTTQVVLEVADGARVVALEQNTHRSRADDRWNIGETVSVGWYPEHALVLR
jgi:spermidine/putrescine transport system ATP-binding protein